MRKCVPGTNLEFEVKDGLVMCPDKAGKWNICEHRGCHQACVIVCDNQGNYTPAPGRSRVPCSGRLELRGPVTSDGLGGVKSSPMGSIESGRLRELGFVLEICDNAECEIFTVGQDGYVN